LTGEAVVEIASQGLDKDEVWDARDREQFRSLLRS